MSPLTNLSILVVETESGVSAIAAELGCATERAGSASAACAAWAARPYDLMFVDDELGGADAVELIRAATASGRVGAVYAVSRGGRPGRVVAAVRAGARDVLAKPLDAARVVEVIGSHAEARPAIDKFRKQLDFDFVGEDAQTLEMLELVRRVADSPATVLVTGPSGTGKELIARALHEGSRRRDRAFVAVNCAAIPESLIESELFGHVRGAFTGADRARDGKLMAANGGTLFLDEVGELPMNAQAKLLRALQERAVTPVGSNSVLPVDVRVVAATNQDLEKMVAEGKFRADLYYRLNVICLEPAPLRERPGDILPLARLFFARANRAHDDRATGLDLSAERALMAYEWPGNVRELGNVIERAVAMSAGGAITADDLRLGGRKKARVSLVAPVAAAPVAPAAAPAPVAAAPAPVLPMPVSLSEVPAALRSLTALPAANDHQPEAVEAPAAAVAGTALAVASLNLRTALDQVERTLIEQALERTDGNRTEAAALLGLNRTTLVEKIRKLGA